MASSTAYRNLPANSPEKDAPGLFAVEEPTPMPISITCHGCKKPIKPQELIFCACCSGKAVPPQQPADREADRSVCTLRDNTGWKIVELVKDGKTDRRATRCDCRKNTSTSQVTQQPPVPDPRIVRRRLRPLPTTDSKSLAGGE